ncbi:MAG: hypothetical protein VX733_12950 [Candidatus Latescibacterota bacterium]|nr:hypothetical protein [Candidatus Latescibacterota bacterium]
MIIVMNVNKYLKLALFWAIHPYKVTLAENLALAIFPQPTDPPAVAIESFTVV